MEKLATKFFNSRVRMLAAKVVKIICKITFTATCLSAIQQWNVQTQKRKNCFYILLL